MKLNKTLIIFILIWSLLPLGWQLYTSFSTPEALTQPFIFSPNRWTFENYLQILNSNPPFWKYLLNSLIVGLLSTAITLIIAVPASYSLSKSNNRFSKLSKLFLAGSAMFPYVILFLSLLEVARKFNLGNNLLAICIPYSALSMPLAILLLTAAFKDIPKDLEEASVLEGLTLFQRLRWILLPLIKPSIASTAILVFLFSWNEYPIALTWISKSELLTLPVAMARLAGSSVYEVPYGAYAAATVIGSIPLLMIVLIFQRQIVSGLTQGAVKG